MEKATNFFHYKTWNFRSVEDINMDNMDKNAFDVFPRLDFVYVPVSCLSLNSRNSIF